MKKLLLWAFLLVQSTSALAQYSTVSMATYNVDGLPDNLIGISINPEGPGDSGSRIISQRLEDSGWDIIGMNEDFNFHDAVTSCMQSYNFQTYSGNIYASASAFFGALAKTWRFDCDGLELATKKGMSVTNETIVPWNNDAVYGYYSNDNDSLTKKGFRYYTVTTADNHAIDVIILHADAGVDTPDILAREAGFEQLYNFINENVKTSHPLVVMGDYNSFYRRDRLQELFIDRINLLPGLTMEDAGRQLGATEELDKILYFNRDACTYKLRPIAAELVTDFVREDGTTQLSDHHPMCATFSIEENIHRISDLTTLIGTLNGSIKTGHQYDLNNDSKSDKTDVDALVNQLLKAN